MNGALQGNNKRAVRGVYEEGRWRREGCRCPAEEDSMASGIHLISHIFLWCGDGGFDSELSWRNLVCCWESQWGEWCRKERCVGQEGRRVGASHLAKGDWRRSLALKM